MIPVVGGRYDGEMIPILDGFHGMYLRLPCRNDPTTSELYIITADNKLHFVKHCRSGPLFAKIESTDPRILEEYRNLSEILNRIPAMMGMLQFGEWMLVPAADLGLNADGTPSDPIPD